MSRVDLVIQELISTEKSYLVHLTDICQGYLKGLLVNASRSGSRESLNTPEPDPPTLKKSRNASPSTLSLFLPGFRNSWNSHKRSSSEIDVQSNADDVNDKLTNQEIEILFGNIKEIHAFHQNFYSVIAGNADNIPLIGKDVPSKPRITGSTPGGDFCF